MICTYIFFDVGRGDSAIRSLNEAMPNGDRSIDLVVLTHLDSDHSRGLLDVLDTYEVGAVLSGEGSADTAMYAQWQAGFSEKRD